MNLILENSLREFKDSHYRIDEDINADMYAQLLGKIINAKTKSFIGNFIGEVRPLSQPSGIIMAKQTSQYNVNPLEFKIIEKLINVTTSKAHIKITAEAWDDLMALLKYSGEAVVVPDMLVNFIKDVSGRIETEAVLKLLKDSAQSDLDLNLPANVLANAETCLFYILKKINTLILKMNETNFKTYDGFCILPQSLFASGVLSLTFAYGQMVDSNDLNNPNQYFLGKLANVKFFVNPNKDEEFAIVGLKSEAEAGVSSFYYCPYSMNLQFADVFQTGHKTIHVFSRNGFEINPCHDKANDPYVYKFKITK